MTSIEKLYSYLSKEGRHIKYGVLTDEIEEPYVTLSLEESEKQTLASIGDKLIATYPVLSVNVYSSNFLDGLNLREEIKDEIKSAAKTTVALLHSKDLKVISENGKYIFTTLYKEIK